MQCSVQLQMLDLSLELWTLVGGLRACNLSTSLCESLAINM